MTDLNQNIHQSDELTLKEIIFLIKEYWYVLWGKKWYLIIAAIFGSVIFTFLEYNKDPIYISELTYMVNEDDGGPLGGAAAILGQFGLAGSAASEYNLDKIVQLSKSRRITENVLFDSLIVAGEDDYVANHIINLYGYHENRWSSDTSLNIFYFDKSSRKLNSNLSKKAAKSLFNHLIGSKKVEGLMSSSYDDKTGILSISTNTNSPELGLAICNGIYKYLSSFYIDQSIEKQKTTLDILKTKADSTYKALEIAEYKFAQQLDNGQGFRLKTSKLLEQELKRDIQILTISYSEILKNKATAEFLLETAKPFFQIIDRPIEPVTKIPKQYLIKFVLGALLGGILLSAFYIIKYIINKALEG